MFNMARSPEGEMKLLMLTKFSTTGPDILAYQGATAAERGSCISRRNAYRTHGVDDWADCDSPTIRANDAIAGREPNDSTRALATKMLPEPAAPRVINDDALARRLCIKASVRAVMPTTCG